MHITDGSLLVLSDKFGQRDVCCLLNDLMSTHEVERDLVGGCLCNVLLLIELKSALLAISMLLMLALLGANPLLLGRLEFLH